MLKDSLYSILSLKDEGNGTYIADITVNADHSIFDGHFPGQPVLPGVCQIEMVKELLMEIKKQSCRLLSAGTIKFLKVVDPNQDSNIQFKLDIHEEEKNLKVTIESTLKDGSPNFKLKGNFALT
ncbi:MAG: hypothetical protein ACK4ND_10350 [Cytophagaceae bacterium]